jgi:hypothetical protein
MRPIAHAVLLVPVLFSTVLCTQVCAQETEPRAVAIVVGATSRVPPLEVETLRDLFLRRRTLLDDGARAVPINLPVGESVRERFSTLVLGRRPAELSAYWDRLYYEGIRPPIVLPSAEAVRRYLQVEEHAIGYLDPRDVDQSVRVIAVFPAPRPAPSR